MPTTTNEKRAMSAKRLHPISASKARRFCCDKHRDKYRKAILGDDDEDQQDDGKPAFGHIDNLPESSAATPPTCKQTCETCAAQYRPLVQQEWEWMGYDCAWNDEKVAEVIKGHLDETKVNLNHVREKLERFGNAVAKRWQKKSISKRVAMLKTAMPEMHGKKRVPVDLLYKLLRQEAVADEVDFTQYHNNWLLPYLDTASLSEDPLKLLALLHYRTKYSQAEWALWDCRQLRTAFSEGALSIAYNPHCVVMRGERFGKLVQWTVDAAHRWEVVGFPLAEMVLEAQNVLAKVTRDVVEALLENGEPAEGNEKWLALAASGFLQPMAAEGCELGLLSRQPFSAPPCFDISVIYEIAQERMHAAADDLWRMQTEPEHDRQLLLNVKASLWYRKQTDVVKQEQLVRMAIGHFARLERWKAVVYHARRAFLFDERVDSDVMAYGLGVQYEQALQILQAELQALFRGQCLDSRGLAALLPTFRQHYRVDDDGEPVVHLAPEEAYESDLLSWSIYQLHDQDSGGVFDPAFLLGCIDDALNGMSGRERALIDGLLVSHLADMAAAQYVLSTLMYNRRSTATSLTDRERQNLCEARAGWPESDKRNAAVTRALDALSDWLGEVLDEFLESMVGQTKRPTKDSLDKFATRHKRLDTFWVKTRAVLDVTLIKGFEVSEGRARIYADAVAMHSHVWLHQADEKRRVLQDAVETQTQADHRRSAVEAIGAVSSMSALTFTQTVWGQEAKAVPVTTPLREKIKTRGLATPTAVNLRENSFTELPEKPGSGTCIAVNAKSLDVFTCMLSPDAPGKRAPKTDWNELVAALADAGCTPAQSGGSAVTFKHEASGGGALVHHRPHPDPTFSALMLKELGKKVQRSFGWDHSTFFERRRGSRNVD